MFRLALTLGLAVAGRASSAQTVQLRGGAWWLSDQNLASGAGLAAMAPLGSRWHLEGTWQRGVQNKEYTCFGAGRYCIGEATRVTSTLYRLALGYRYPLLRGARWSAGTSGSAGIARLYTIRERPPAPGGADYKITYVLLQTGMDAQRQILAAAPLRLVAGGRAGLAIAPSPMTMTDGGEMPFWDHFALAGVELGFAWPLGGASARH